MDIWDDADGGGNPPPAAPVGPPMDFDELVRTYHDQLMGRARGLCRDEGMAEDAVQETLLRAWQALPTLPADVNLGGWLHRVLTNITIDQHRRSEREARRVAAVAGVEAGTTMFMPDHGPSVDDRLAMHDALSSLGEGHREALLMRDMAGHDYASIATTSGTTAINARARVHRARTAMRTQLMASGVRRASLVTILLAIAIALLLLWFTSRIGHDDTQRPPDRGLTVDRSVDAPGSVRPGGSPSATTTPRGGGSPDLDEDGTPGAGDTTGPGTGTRQANVSPGGRNGAGEVVPGTKPVTGPTTPGTTTTTCQRCVDRPPFGTVRGEFEADPWEGRDAPTGFRAVGTGGVFDPTDRDRQLVALDTVAIRRFQFADGGTRFSTDLLASGPDGPIWLETSGFAEPTEAHDGYLLRGDYELKSGGTGLPLAGSIGLSLRFTGRAVVGKAVPATPVRAQVRLASRPQRFQFGPGSITVDAFEDIDQDGNRGRDEASMANAAAEAIWMGPDGRPDTGDEQPFALSESPEGHLVAEGLPLGTYQVVQSLISGWVITGQAIDDVPLRITMVTLDAATPAAALELPTVRINSLSGHVRFAHPLSTGFEQPMQGTPYRITAAGADGTLDTADDEVTEGSTDVRGGWYYDSLHPTVIRIDLRLPDGWIGVSNPRGDPDDQSFTTFMRGAGRKDLDFVIAGSAAAQMAVRPAPGFATPEAIDVAAIAWGLDGRLGTEDDIVLVVSVPLEGQTGTLGGLPPGRVSLLLDRTALGAVGSQVTRPEEALLTVEAPPGGTVHVPFALVAE